MSFTPNIPASGQSLGNSRLQVLNNFSNYNTVVSVDHVDPNSAGQGKHKWVHLPIQAPLPTAAANELVIFSQSSNSITTPYWRRDASTTNVPLFPIKAFCVLNSAGALVGTYYNVTSSTPVGGVRTIVLTANAVSSVNFGVFVTSGGANASTNTASYSNITNNGGGVFQFQIVLRANTIEANDPCSIMVVEFV